MDIKTWSKLLGKGRSDPQVSAAFAVAGVKKIPKLAKDDFETIVDLKGHGLWLVMKEEAAVAGRHDLKIREGRLILSQVGAYVVRKGSRDLYRGRLPYNILADMTRAEVRKLLGPPASIDDDLPFDTWSLDDLEFVARYTREELKLRHVSHELVKSQLTLK